MTNTKFVQAVRMEIYSLAEWAAKDRVLAKDMGWDGLTRYPAFHGCEHRGDFCLFVNRMDNADAMRERLQDALKAFTGEES